MEAKIRQFILAVRTNYSALVANEERDVYNIRVFRSATQAVVAQFQEPEFECSLFYTDSAKEDLLVSVVAEIKTSDIPDRLSDLLQPLETPEFESAWGNDHSETLKRVMEFAVRSFLQDFLSRAMTKTAGFMWSPAKQVAIFCRTGSWHNLNIEAAVRFEIELAEQLRRPPFKPMVYFRSTAHKRNGSAARFLTIAKQPVSPVLSFSDEIKALFSKSDDNPWKLREPLWGTNYGKVDIIIFSSGIVVADTPHVTGALDALNSFLAIANFLGLSCMPTTRWDLGNVDISEQGAVQSWGGPTSFSRTLRWPKQTTATVDQLQSCIRVFELAQGDSELIAQLRLGHAAVTHFLSSEYLQTFLLAWAIVEREIEQRWTSVLTAKNIEGRRLQKLLKNDEFTVNQLTEILELFGCLDGNMHVLIQSLRKVRNDVVHRGLVPTAEQAKECLQVANTFISTKLDKVKTQFPKD
jgi:hypothetical protein